MYRLKKESEPKFSSLFTQLIEELEEALKDSCPLDLKTIRGSRRIVDPNNRHVEPMNIRELSEF